MPAMSGNTANEIVGLKTPSTFGTIGRFYRDFHQMTSIEVTKLLARAPYCQ